MKNFLQKSFVLPVIVILAVGLVVVKVKTKSPVEHEVLQFPIKTVAVITVKKRPFRPRATAYGYVEPAVLVTAKAEVSGKISYLHPELSKGGSIARGEVVLRIDPTTFEFSLDQSKAGLAGSQSSLRQLEVEEKTTGRSLTIAQANLLVGEKELRRLRKIVEKQLIASSVVDVEQQKVLQLRQQVEDLQGRLASYVSRKTATRAQIRQSKAQLAQSEDTLGRTEVMMPFDARIGTVSVEKGEFIPIGGVLFEALGTQGIEIAAQLPTRQFRPLLIGLGPQGFNLQDPKGFQSAVHQLGLEAHIRLVGSDDNDSSWSGELLRISESIDPTRDTVGLIVGVDNPYGGVIPGKRPPLLKGMYTSVEFIAPARNLLLLPRKALHQGRVYIAGVDNRLEIRAVTVLHKQGEFVVIAQGLNEGEKVIVTDIIPVVEGLPLKLVDASDDEAWPGQVALESINTQATGKYETSQPDIQDNGDGGVKK